MFATLLQCLFFIVWFVHLEADVYQDRPRIKTNDGHLILEPGSDKNIYLQTNGPKSTIFVGGVNLLNINITDRGDTQYQTSNIDLESYINGPEGILRRLERLESRRDVQTSDGPNVTLLWRRINRLTTRVANLQILVNSMGRDHCQSRPCLHGGTCLNQVNGYYCLCPTNWEGNDCSEDINECRMYQGTDLGCQNGANCKNTPGSYECECRQGWYGQHCTRRNKDCSGGDFEMCGHGTCVPTNTGQGIKCICDQGWTNNGTNDACLTDVNECESIQGPRCSVNPRVECINLPGSFRCGQCPSGYEGDGYICSDIDECLSMPNGGCSTSPMVTCHNTVGSRICGPCPNGYQGDGITCTWRGSCSINRGGCHPSAQCIDNSALGGQMAQCICPPGMEGDGIGLHGCYVTTGNLTQGCDTNPCGVHGQCHPLRSGYTCICYRGYGGARCDSTYSYCSRNPCLNGGRCSTDESSPRGFRCECTAQFSGDLCHVAATTCGGYLQAEAGSIVYPLSNTTYNHNARCAWVIHTESDKVINVTFSKFNLEVHPECMYDFLQIHDGRSSASQLIGRFCGNEFPKGGNIISSHNNLYFWFRSDQSVAKDGFALHWTSIDPVCGGQIDARVHGQISTPGSPGKYPPNRDCYWHLYTTLGKRIQLHFFSLDIEAHPNCSYDFVSIYDGEHITDPLLGQYCNSTHPAPVMSAGSDMLVHFHSDGYNAGYGFQATFAPAEGMPGCGGLFTSERGEISSPSYDGQYLSNVLCEYKIKIDPGNKIRINFKLFKLERSVNCRYDYLKVYDGPSEESPLVGRFCGNTFPKSYTSSTNEIFLKFRSDHSVSGEGFRIAYETVCQQTVIGDSGVIKSPGYPFSYPANRVCEYLIGTAPGKIIQLTFQDFDIEDNNYFNCQYDHVEIRDGVNINATLLGKYCGGTQHTPPMTTSTHNYMYLRFSSDMSISGTGFYANFTTVDVECGGIYKETSGTINHPSNQDSYSNNQHCVWILIAPEGTHIKMTWNRFNIERISSCASDYVLITEVDENNEKNDLGKYCGSTLPPTITTTTNQLEVTFQSDFSVRAEGFSVSYAFLDEQSHCGGTYTKTHGYLYSPGWPKRYPSNRNCEWTITAPAGQQIVLNITQFNLERPLRNICDYGDYLDIRNGASQSSPLIERLCGSFQSKRIISFSNTLFLQFHSDSYISGTGFKIEWDSTVSGCGGKLTSPSGSLSSPNFPFNYNENAECFYRIVTSAGSKIRLSFTELELEITHNCRDDYVELFDGRDENSPSLGKYCNKNPELRTIESTTNYVFIKFRSDFYIGGKGFLIQYDTICKNNLTGLHGVIESPGYPGVYPNVLDCLWTINVPKGNRINVTFTNFDVGRRMYRSTYNLRNYQRFSEPRGISGYNDRMHLPPPCFAEYIQMKDSTDINFGEKLCGQTLPARVTTQGNSFQIKFYSSSYLSMLSHGFRLEWARFGCGGHIQKTYGTIIVDSSLTSHGELECDWVIETTPGTSVTLNMIDLYMDTSKNCTTDAIEFFNGKDTNAPLLTKICHRNAVGVTTVGSTTNFMLIRFVKRSSLKDVQFSAMFNSYHTGCGGRIETLSGVIHSQNYPSKNYDNNLNCMWSLVVPKNHRVEVNFLDFDLYSDSDADCEDCIKIYDGEYVLDTNYTKRICPNTPLSPIISKKNMLGVQFISDNYGTAKGFKANFTVICGATITAKLDGIIASDKWHNTHILDNCTWTILAPSLDQKISLTVTYLSIPKDKDVVTNRNCPTSFLRVLDGDDANAPQVDEYCGHKVPPMIVSRGSALTLIFGAYNGTAQGQFAVHYSSLTSTCGGILTSEEGSIASPNYPQSYPGNISCEWTLSTSPGNRVYITFERFDLEWSEQCNEDYLEVRENNGVGTLLGVYCGSEIPTNTTTATKLYLKFHSNSENNGKGFLLHYGYLHGNEINGLTSGEIASLLYPHKYFGVGEYTWRISTESHTTISITVINFEVPTEGSICYSALIFYDGYDDEAPILQEICGILESSKEIITSSNVAFIKLKLDESNSGSLFHLRWAIADTDMESSYTSTKANCGMNETKIISPGQEFKFESPEYPKEYKNNLNCEWVFQAEPGRHINLHFSKFQLEQTPGCFADSVSIFSSNSLSSWKPVKEEMCLSEDVKDEFNSSKYMRVVFKTDASVTQKGFEAKVKSACGGFISGLSGTVEPRFEDLSFMSRRSQKCQWIVKVRPGRVIKLNFDHFNITSTDNECPISVTIRNGDSDEAPLLGNGKFCGKEQEVKSNIETTSNVVFITYIFDSTPYLPLPKFANFRLRYEEKGVECGMTSTLDTDHPWEVFNSPNYPSVPTPYTECVWVFTGPPGEILRLDFVERLDLDQRSDCSLEYVEIRDGSTDISQVKGRYCGKTKPSTIKTSGNSMYIKYYTQLAEPRDGFKANVTIDVCGGTIIANRGEVTSPGYPHFQAIPYGTICEWRIIGSRGLTLFITPQDINLPEPALTCGTKVTIEENERINNTITVLQTYCADDNDDLNLTPIQTSSNEIIIKLHIGTPSDWSAPVTHRGFRFIFNSSRPSCGGIISTPEGFLTSPGYPRETSIRYCNWRIEIPDKSRRIRLEILDSSIEKQRIGVYNDLLFQSPLQPESTNVYESNGNTMGLYFWLDSRATKQRFKAKFSSNEAALCGGDLSDPRGELFSPELDRSYSCRWSYKPNLSTNDTFKTLYVSAKLNSSTTRNLNFCTFSEPKVIISSFSSLYSGFSKQLCGNIDKSFTIPSSAMRLYATKPPLSSLYFHIEWKLNPCGGIIEVSEKEINLLDIPSDHNDTLDCNWIIRSPFDTRAQIKLEGSFQLDCDSEYVKIKQGFDDTSPAIADYCKDKMQEVPLATPFRYMIVEYHSIIKSKTTIRLSAQLISDQCGGLLSGYQRIFESPHFPHHYDPNVECSWEIRTFEGNRISLRFIERFAIEDRPNCTKDAVIIYDWKDDTWVQMGRVCGRSLPPVFNSTYNTMKVVFRSDAETQLDGFKAQWDTVCGGRYQATNKVQYLYSPGSPYMYLPDMDCKYEILGGDSKVSIQFLDFNLEGTYPSCAYDNLTITADSDYDYLQATYCESEKPIISNEYNRVTLTFKTDSYIQRKGFKLSYQLYTCGGHIKQPTVISSNPDSDSYSNNENCTWIIEAPKNKIVVINFQYIELEQGYCYSDYVALFNSYWVDEDKQPALLCGTHKLDTPTTIRSTDNNMVVQFISDSSYNFKGFKADVFFSYSSAVGCGGDINLTNLPPGTTKDFSSPLINGSTVYENFLDCLWTITAPSDYTVTIKFIKFHIAPCEGINQTAIGFSKCDCDSVQITDGINPNDLVIGTYCGHNIPDGQELMSSGNHMTVRLFTDGEIASAGFKAQLSLQRHICGQRIFTVDNTKIQTIKSPSYTTGSIPRGVHCVYHIAADTEQYNTLHITIKNLDLRSGEPNANVCNKDKLLIISVPEITNSSLGKDFILRGHDDYFYSPSYLYYEDELQHPNRYEFCGTKTNVDLYLKKSATIHLQTSPDSDSLVHKGVELEISNAGFCGRNYTELQGRITSVLNWYPNNMHDCYTLITVPENYTISLYFLYVDNNGGYDADLSLDIYDGEKTSSPKLYRISSSYESEKAFFSTGRHVLLHNSFTSDVHLSYDLNYVATDKGQGCGGKLHNLLGKVTSPLYPKDYRQKATCEWELETPSNTHLRLRFPEFDLGRACDTNYVQLVDRSGKIISTYCEETPADYTSTDNYVKIVFTTTRNNAGTGWVAEFIAIV